MKYEIFMKFQIELLNENFEIFEFQWEYQIMAE